MTKSLYPHLNPTLHGLGHEYLAIKAVNWAKSRGMPESVRRYANAVNLTQSPEDPPTIAQFMEITDLFSKLTKNLDCSHPTAIPVVISRSMAEFS